MCIDINRCTHVINTLVQKSIAMLLYVAAFIYNDKQLPKVTIIKIFLNFIIIITSSFYGRQSTSYQ